MIEILGGAVGGVFGGLLRLAPEVMKLWDRANERKHELAMADIEVRIAEKKIEFGMRQVDATVDVAHLNAISEAMKGQAAMAKAGGKVAAALSALVRPLVTYWFVALYSAVKIATMILAYMQSETWSEVLVKAWTPDDMAILTGILAFWFVGRVLERPKG